MMIDQSTGKETDFSKLRFVSLQLVKKNGSQTTFSISQACGFHDTEEEAVGKTILTIMKDRPEWLIESVLVMSPFSEEQSANGDVKIFCHTVGCDNPVPKMLDLCSLHTESPSVPMSRCNKCDMRYPSAPAGNIHKCGRCEGGICHPEEKAVVASNEGVSFVDVVKHFQESGGLQKLGTEGFREGCIYSGCRTYNKCMYSPCHLDKKDPNNPLDEVSQSKDDVIKQMTQRFLSWKLPTDFCPDEGISFTPSFTEERMGSQQWPVGTNLLSYTQAEQMVCHILDTDSEFVIRKDDREMEWAIARRLRELNKGQLILTTNDDGGYEVYYRNRENVDKCPRERNTVLPD